MGHNTDTDYRKSPIAPQCF